MYKEKEQLIDENSISLTSTKENDEDKLYSIIINNKDYWPNNNDENNQLIINKMINIFSNNNNFEYDINSLENKSYILLGKKHNQESSISNFTPIYNAENNEKKEKIFDIYKDYKNNKKVYRLDYFKKLFIKSFLKYLLNYGKQLISKLDLDKELINLKLHMPNYILYAGNPKEKDNREFLTKKIKIVFMDYNKELNKGISRQKNNEKLIKKLYELIKIPLSENEKNVIYFFEMTIEKGIEMYYESEEFNMFKNNKINQYYDEMFYNEKKRKFYLLEKNGFIKLVNMPFYSKFPK